jgi:hypothetical protein
MVADEVDYVVGVDTHLEKHVPAVVSAPTGAVLARRSVRENARGYSGTRSRRRITQASRNGFGRQEGRPSTRSPTGRGVKSSSRWRIRTEPG